MKPDSAGGRGRRLDPGLVVVLGVLGLGLLVTAWVSRSVVGVIGALVVTAAALCWWRSDRTRPDGVVDPDDPDQTDGQDYPANLGAARWALLSITALLVGLATFGVGMIKGW